MPRFYFDIHEHNRVIVDDHGEDLPDADAASWRAFQCAGELLRFSEPAEIGERITIDVRDARRLIRRIAVLIEVESFG